MTFVMDYVRAVMQKDNTTGMELLKLNEKHLQEEVAQMQSKIEQEKSEKKHPKQNKL